MAQGSNVDKAVPIDGDHVGDILLEAELDVLFKAQVNQAGIVIGFGKVGPAFLPVGVKGLGHQGQVALGGDLSQLAKGGSDGAGGADIVGGKFALGAGAQDDHIPAQLGGHTGHGGMVDHGADEHMGGAVRGFDGAGAVGGIDDHVLDRKSVV